jgi:anti-sigma regulatory factor (Ser/Thr protein kinase)
MACRVETTANRVVIVGTISHFDLRRLTATLFNLTSRLGYENLVVDFARCAAAYPGPMAGLCAQALELRRKGVDIEFVAPSKEHLQRLFTNSNWAHLLDPERQKASTYRGYANMPLVQFGSPDDQTAVVNRLMDAMLSSVASLDRADFAAIEWCMNEITDNVLVHAHSEVGGLVTMASYKKQRRIEFSVADPGISIPTSLRQGHPHLRQDLQALEQAVKEGVTRDASLGQGNGLFGTFQVARTSRGYMHIHSGNARLDYEDDQLRITKEDIPFTGTLVIVGLDCTNPTVLGEALRFQDAKHTPLDYIETHFEDQSTDRCVFRMSAEAASFGSRVAGAPVRTKLENLVRMNARRRVVVDMNDIPLISSSFADEVFGKLYVSLGPLLFGQAVEFRQIAETVRSLIDRAIMQRVAQATSRKT